MTGKQPPPSAGEIALAELIASLEVERLGDGHYRATAPARRRTRLFGGHVLAQVLAAATRHVDRPEMVVRSLQCQFLRAGTPGTAVDLGVTTTAIGRTFAACHVRVDQDTTPLIDALVRFHVPTTGASKQFEPPLALIEPLSLLDYPSRLATLTDKLPDWQAGFVPVDVRFEGEPAAGTQTTAFRAHVALGDDPTVHAAVATYASDMTLIGVAPESFGLHWWSPGVELASLDHAIWFHQPFRADEWVRYVQRTVSAGAGRALVEGSMFDPGGQLVATVAQDGVMRLP